MCYNFFYYRRDRGLQYRINKLYSTEVTQMGGSIQGTTSAPVQLVLVPVKVPVLKI